MRIYSLDHSQTPSAIAVSLQRTLKPHTSPVITAAIDRSSSLLATGSSDGVIKVWDIRGGFISHTFRGHTGVLSALCFFELPPELAASEASAISTERRKKSILKGKVRKNQANQKSATETSALRLASGGEDGKIRVWDLVKRAAVASLESHVSVVRGLDFSPVQAVLLSGSRDKTLIVWDARTWETERIIPVLESVEAAGLIGDGRLAYSGGERGRLRIWEVKTGREVTTEQQSGVEDEGIVDVLWISADQSLLSIHANQALDFYSIRGLAITSQETTIDPLPLLRRISGTHDEVIDLAYVGLRKNLMALATNEEYVKLVSVISQDEVSGNAPYFGADVAHLQGHEDIVICLDADWSGCWLATGAKDNTARLWRIDHSAGLYDSAAIFTGHAESIGAIALPLQPPPADSAAFKSPLQHPPTLMLTGSQDKTIKMWEISNKAGKPLQPAGALYTRKAHEKDINAIAINHNSTLFASASQDRTVKIWSLQEGETQGVLRGHKRGVWSVKFAPKDTPTITGDFGAASSSRGLVLTGSGDKTVKIWSLSDYSCVRTFEGHTNTVLKVLWLPQSNQEDPESKKKAQPSALVASAGSDGLVKVWDALDGECACTLDNHTDRVWALATNSSTGHLVSGGGDGVVTFWADTTASTAAATAAASTARVEQEQELANHVHRGNYRDAIVLSLQLNHPARLLALFKDVVEKHPPEQGSMSGLVAVDNVLAELGDEQLYTLLLRLRDWNTNARTAHVAQRIMWVVAKNYPASRLVGLRKKGRGLGDVLDALRAYTERHYKRCEELIEESYLVDFVVRGMEDGGFVVDDTSLVKDSKAEADVIMVE
ncbi:MAG: hypothetical protein LQ340_001752 [Diploschistes diacapsis]|nr:MAG: hypothetical protein LQ340_001752 [Diploschistes diacapsis]